MSGSSGTEVSQETAVRQVLMAVRAFSDAMDRMYSGMKDDMDMNGTDLAALRMLIIREQRGETVSPHDIARHLRISTASTTKLLDRLSDAGHVVRLPHPSDGRARIVALTPLSKDAFFRHFRDSMGAMRGVAEDFTPEELTTVTEFLIRLSEAIDPEA